MYSRSCSSRFENASQTYHLPYILTAIATFALRVHACPAERRAHRAIQGKELEVVSDAKTFRLSVG
jgi:hypothetical protein